MKFNEDSRVKIPTLLHLIRLGYQYLSLKGANWRRDTNIFTDIFVASLRKINVGLTEADALRLLDEISLLLDNEDVGKAFYERLVEKSGVKLIDFEDFHANTFNIVTELPCEKEEESFRPDITLLINGMPLAFIEVKKPNNREGILAERDRMVTRFQNKRFRNFFNITQLMVFSNNMEYDDGSPQPLAGAFYATASYQKPSLNYFREEEDLDLSVLLQAQDDAVENFVLKDTNLVSIKHSPEFATNKDPNRPTNRICTSLFSKDRLAFILEYALAYVQQETHLEKHIMRYPQLFATKAIGQKLDEGIRKGIIWHTQGSGKTALAFYNVKHLTAYFQQQGIVAKFYFIVDRLDLLNQASKEFTARGLKVQKVNSREEFARTIKSRQAVENNDGAPEITVVNIQKFQDDPTILRNTDYNLSLQRVYFLDEVHRSYNPKGSFLANLRESDPNSIKIGLTGTPLLGDDYNSRSLFGGYIHKYYYNKSIADGYTLRLIREEIETSYKLTLAKALAELEIIKGKADRGKLYAHENFVEPMLAYIVKDFEQARFHHNDDSIGGMVVCDSSAQARMMYKIFQEKYMGAREYTMVPSLADAAEPLLSYAAKKKAARQVRTAALILHDAGTKKEIEDRVEAFKAGKIDFLFVFNMLLTGFDAKRLKKLYIGRVIKSHNLLQTLTRVNRTYHDFQYGYVVDFADISSEFDKTNKAYFDELQDELGDEMQHYSDLFLSAQEIETQIKEIEDAIFDFTTNNAAVFSQQISEINDRSQMLELTRALNQAKSLYNLIRLSGNYELLEKLDFRKLTILARLANDRLQLINTRDALENQVDNTNLLNMALEEVLFAFTKVGEAEMVLADELKNILQKTREALAGSMDPKDPEIVSLRAELERLFRKKNLSEITREDMEANIADLTKLYARTREQERKDQLLRAKYDYDAKYARVHKRILEKGDPAASKSQLLAALSGLKEAVDTNVQQNPRLLENESYAEKMMVRLVIEQFKNKNNISLTAESAKFINQLVVKEYLNDYYGRPI
ncbi:type I restriction endonuclease subunit R [Lewinella sp. LCG006]|uniref:type I restriction endonuclease subunit R n=1 Tax=Lewinella sp. LCG006 TaxID=3231911 RepID=UPI00345FC0F2